MAFPILPLLLLGGGAAALLLMSKNQSSSAAAPVPILTTKAAYNATMKAQSGGNYQALLAAQQAQKSQDAYNLAIAAQSGGNYQALLALQQENARTAQVAATAAKMDANRAQSGTMPEVDTEHVKWLRQHPELDPCRCECVAWLRKYDHGIAQGPSYPDGPDGPAVYTGLAGIGVEPHGCRAMQIGDEGGMGALAGFDCLGGGAFDTMQTIIKPADAARC